MILSEVRRNDKSSHPPQSESKTVLGSKSKDLVANMAKFAKLTEEIGSTIQELDSKEAISLPSPEEKQQLLIAAKELVDKLEGPEVGVWRVLYGVSIKKWSSYHHANAKTQQQPQGYGAVKAAIGMRIFDVFENQDTAEKLSAKTGAEKMLIGEDSFPWI